jgi:raffinose/stachyose/melibiose transport system substrate-binding protein
MQLSLKRGRRRASVATAVIATAAIASLAALTGCSSGSSGDSGSKTITYLSWDNQTTMQPLIDEFKKETGITVKASYAAPVNPYIQKLQTQLSSNTAPDVFILTAENKAQLLSSHAVVDLTPYSWTSVLADAAKKTYTQDGKLWGASPASWGAGYLVNKDLLAKVGATELPQTWDEFIALLKKLKDAGITPIYDVPDGFPTAVNALVGQENKKLGGKMDEEIWAGKTSFKKTWTPSLELYNQLYTEGLSPRSAAGLTAQQATDEFNQGKVAMIGAGSWVLSGVRQSAPNLNVEYQAVPGPTTSFLAGAVNQSYAINAKTKNKDSAAKFIQFLLSKKGVEMYQKETGLITTTSNYTPTIDPAMKTLAGKVRDGDFYLPQVTWPDHSDVMATEGISLIQQMISGKLTPQQVAEGMDAKLASFK